MTDDVLRLPRPIRLFVDAVTVISAFVVAGGWLISGVSWAAKQSWWNFDTLFEPRGPSQPATGILASVIERYRAWSNYAFSTLEQSIGVDLPQWVQDISPVFLLTMLLFWILAYSRIVWRSMTNTRVA